MRMCRGLAGAVLLLVAVLVGANTANAAVQGYVWLDYTGYDGDSSVTTWNDTTTAMYGRSRSGLGFGEFTFNVKGFQNGAIPNPNPLYPLEVALYTAQVAPDPDVPLKGYCIDSGQYLDGNTNKHEIRNLEDMFLNTLAGGVDPQIALDGFVSGPGYGGAAFPDTSPVSARVNKLKNLFGQYLAQVDTPTERAAFAAATWEIIYEDSGSYNLATGDFKVTGLTTGPTGADTQAAFYLNNLDGASFNNDVYALYDPTAQDFAVVIKASETAVPVPEPFTALTAFLAIGSFGMYVRKHTRKPQNPAKTLS